MVTSIVLVFVTAAVTSALTIAAAWYLYQRYLKQILISWIDGKATELGEQLKDRVREGVREGIRDGAADVGSNVVRKTRESATKSGLGMFEDSMSFWFGAGKKKPPGTDDDQS